MGQGMPGINSPNRNPQCGQMDMRPSSTMKRRLTNFSINVLQPEMRDDDAENDAQIFLLNNMVSVLSWPVIQGVEQYGTSAFAEHANIAH